MVEWNVNRILNLFKFLLRQNQSGSISTTDFFNAWNTEQYAYHSDLLGPWERMSNSKSGANTGLIMNETIMGKLSPFTIAGSVAISSGQATKPTDFIYGLARRLELNGDEFLVTKINHGQKWYVNNDAIDPPSVTDGTYYIIEYENYYDVLPTSATGNLQLDYIAKPENISWGFTYDNQNRPVYNAGLSVQPKWDDSTIIAITKRALANFGVSYKDKDFTNFAKSNIATGDS
jgi:hypothetical protein